MCKFLSLLMLPMLLGFTSDIISFDNNWGKYPLFNLIAETPNGVEVVFSMHQMAVEDLKIDGITMNSYGVPAVFLPQEGSPNLTGACRYIALPKGATPKLTILGTRTETNHNVEVAPAPNIPLETDKNPLSYKKDMKIYGQNTYYPESPVRLSKVMRIRGVDVVLVGVIPFQYNPKTKELIIYKDIKFKIEFAGGNGHFGEDRLRSRFWDPILQGNLLNYNSLPKIDYYDRFQDRNPGEYLIIVPEDSAFIAWADTIKNWRQLQGISCDVFTLDEIGSTPWDIEVFINEAYYNWNPAPVAFLILSDYPSPSFLNGVPSPLWNNYCVSDNIYADVDGDNLPDMHHARICAQNEAQLGVMVNKFLRYERNPCTSAHFYNYPLVACVWQSDRWFQLCTEVIRGFLINRLGKSPIHQYTGNPTPGCAWSTRQGSLPVVAYWNNYGYVPLTNPNNADWWNNGSASGINSAINAGAFLVQHRDHGSTTGWDNPPYHNADLDGLTNTQLPFVYSTNCLTGKYNWSNECFTEKFHRIIHGALGLNAASEVSYSFVNDTYAWGIYDGLWQQFDPNYPAPNWVGNNLNPCIAMTNGKYYLEAMWFPDSVTPNNPYRTITYHLFHHHGDAFVTLSSESPRRLSVTHAPVLLAGQTSFTVTADDSSVIALTVNGEIIGVAQGTGMPVTIMIHGQIVPPNTMIVTVTKANSYRYQASVAVIPHGPYVLYYKHTVWDPPPGGNNNGRIDPGETVYLMVWVKNWGDASVIDCHGRLCENDAYVTLLDSITNLGNLNPGDTAISSPYFRIRVENPGGPVIPIRRVIQFTLLAYTDGGQNWSSQFREVISGFPDNPNTFGTTNGRDDKRTTLRLISPNPFASEVNIAYELANNSPVSLMVYDVSGRLVRVLEQGIKNCGSYVVTWDGRDNARRELVPGVYFIRFDAGDYKRVEKALLWR